MSEEDENRGEAADMSTVVAVEPNFVTSEEDGETQTIGEVSDNNSQLPPAEAAAAAATSTNLPPSSETQTNVPSEAVVQGITSELANLAISEDGEPANSSLSPDEAPATTSTLESTTATMPSNEELLLRDWQEDVQGDDGTLSPPVVSAVPMPVTPSTSLEGQGGGNTTSTSNNETGAPDAPAATAAAARQASSGSSGNQYTYPVATFVSNFVRGAVDNLQNSYSNSAIFAAAIPENETSTSIRSAPDTSSGTHGNQDPTTTTTARSLDSHMAAASMHSAMPTDISTTDASSLGGDSHSISLQAATNRSPAESTEYVLIDGDLVAIPSQHHHVPRNQRRQRHASHLEQHLESGEEEDESSILNHHQNRSRNDTYNSTGTGYDDIAEHLSRLDRNNHCTPKASRVRRGVKGLKRLFKRDKGSKNKRGLKMPPVETGRQLQVHSQFTDESTDILPEHSGAADSYRSEPFTLNDFMPQDYRTSGASLQSNQGTEPEAAAGPKKPPPPAPSEDTTPTEKSPKRRAFKKKIFRKNKSKNNLVELEQQRQQLQQQQLEQQPPLSLDPLATNSISQEAQGGNYTTTAPLLHHQQDPNDNHSSLTAMDDATPFLSPSHHTHTANDDATDLFHRSVSAEADFLGNLDDNASGAMIQATLLPAAEAYIEDRLEDYDKYDDVKSKVHIIGKPPSSDFKVDKQDAPCVDSMLRMADQFVRVDEEEDDDDSSVQPMTRGKSDGQAVPLSRASSKDPQVVNDILKCVFVADSTVDKSALVKALRKSNKKTKRRTTLGVEVHSWSPLDSKDVKFSLWDVQGATLEDHYGLATNFGAHPGTQSLFFSDRSLYLLVWDLGWSNRKTHRHPWKRDQTSGSNLKNDDSDDSSTSSSDDEDFDHDNDYLREEANRQADFALQADIEERCLSWVDCIARKGAHSAILPVAIIPPGMSPLECKRRCDIFQTLLQKYTQQRLASGYSTPPKVLTGAETILCVSFDTSMGLESLEETILAIATDSSQAVFDHVGTPVPKGTTQVLEAAKRLKRDHKLILVDHIMGDLHKSDLSVDNVIEALQFLSSIGELLYFGSLHGDEVLSRYVILSRKWLVSAISCILRNDLKRELLETRRFMNMQSLYSNQQYPENPITQTFTSHASNCPLLSSTDTQMLWQSMSFMREAADRTLQLVSSPTNSTTIFGFLEHLLISAGVFMPLDIKSPVIAPTLDPFLNSMSEESVYFCPSLLAPHVPEEDGVLWTYKSSESWMTTLSHSWLFRDGTPSGLMEEVTVGLLRDLYEFSRTKPSSPKNVPNRSISFPMDHGNDLPDFAQSHPDGGALGAIRIHQMMCWKSSLLIKIGSVFLDESNNSLRESFVEVFVTIADQSSPYCVASTDMRSSMQRLIVSGKGQVGHGGHKLWKGGYNLVVNSIMASIAHVANVDRQVVCPECLAQLHPSNASTWSWDSVRGAASSGSSLIRCMRGHKVDAKFVCGIPAASKNANDPSSLANGPAGAHKKSIQELLPSVVVVGLWDPISKTIRHVGSGFVADKKQGLILTAAHVLIDMKASSSDFGQLFFGISNARVVIGVIPDEQSNIAVFRYFADLVPVQQVPTMDACVLRISARLPKDVAEADSIPMSGIPLTTHMVMDEQLPSLKLTKRYELEETIRIIGYNQGGEGLFDQGQVVHRSADFAKGYICKQFKQLPSLSDSSHQADTSSSVPVRRSASFTPREEIVAMISTIPGHSGGPVVNEQGKVVGILSRADPVDRQRAYLVPASELKWLLGQAKDQVF